MHHEKKDKTEFKKNPQVIQKKAKEGGDKVKKKTAGENRKYSGVGDSS